MLLCSKKKNLFFFLFRMGHKTALSEKLKRKVITVLIGSLFPSLWTWLLSRNLRENINTSYSIPHGKFKNVRSYKNSWIQLHAFLQGKYVWKPSVRDSLIRGLNQGKLLVLTCGSTCSLPLKEGGKKYRKMIKKTMTGVAFFWRF